MAASTSRGELHVELLSSDSMRQFWDFATTVRRTRSLANRESARIRGTWLTEDLAVQRVHGWGARAVRLLCVRAVDAERAARLKLFFQKDKHNMEGRLKHVQDPLDREPQVLVKVPYDVSLAGCVEHERTLLKELAGLEGVPQMAEPIYFDDVGMPVMTYDYSATPSLQDQLEVGHLIPPEGLYRLVSFALATLDRVHARGWLHTDLHPRDILLDVAGAAAPPSEGTSTAPGLLCGWAHAVRWQANEAPTFSQGLAELVRLLPVTVPRPEPSLGNTFQEMALRILLGDAKPKDAAAGVAASAEVGEDTAVAGTLTSREGAASVSSDSAAAEWGSELPSNREMGGPSAFSAPEQLLGLFAGAAYDAAATDVYRAAAVALVAVRARGPLGSPERPMEPAAARSVGRLRRLCHETILRRAEGAGEALPTADEAREFGLALQQLLDSKPNLVGCGGVELDPWFCSCLAREPQERHQTASRALEAFSDAWSRLEARLLARHRAEAQTGSLQAEVGPRPRIVLEKPPQLEGMQVL